jgi:hypothetical protein
MVEQPAPSALREKGAMPGDEQHESGHVLLENRKLCPQWRAAKKFFFGILESL